MPDGTTIDPTLLPTPTPAASTPTDTSTPTPDTSLEGAYDPSVHALRLNITPQPLKPPPLGPGVAGGQEPGKIISPPATTAAPISLPNIQVNDINSKLPPTKTAAPKSNITVDDINRGLSTQPQPSVTPAEPPIPPSSATPPTTPTLATTPTPTPQIPAGKTTGVAANLGAGFGEGVATTLGLPVDFTTGGVNLGIKGVNALAGTNIQPITSPFLGSNSIQSLMTSAGFGNPTNVVPASTFEQAVRSGGNVAASMLIPGLGADALASRVALTGVPGAINTAIQGGGPLRNVVTGVGAGITGQALENQVPEPYKPIANFVGQLAGGGVTHLSADAVKWLASTVPHVYNFLVGGAKMPWQKTSTSLPGSNLSITKKQGLMAARQIVNKFSTGSVGPRVNHFDVLDWLLAGDTEDVPGSFPTSYEAAHTGLARSGYPIEPEDEQTLAALGDLQRYAETRSRELFVNRANQQSAARSKALQKVKPFTNINVADELRTELANLDKSNADLEGSARQTAQQRMQETGGQGTAEQYGTQIRSDIERSQDPAIQEANRAIAQQEPVTEQAVGSLGEEAARPETRGTAAQRYGRELRGQAGSAEEPGSGVAGEAAAEKSNVAELYNLVPKDLAVNTTTLKSAAAKTEGMFDEAYGDVISSTEHNLLDRIHDLPNSTNYGKLMILRSNISQAVREAAATFGYKSRPVARLIQLKAGLDDTIVDTVEGQIKTGQSTNFTRSLRDWWNGKISYDQALQRAQSGTPGFDPLTAEGFSAARRANAARLDYQQRFNQGATGDVLRAGREGELYRLEDSEVPGKFWNSGKTAAEDVQSALKAAGNNADFKRALTDYATFDLRRTAEIRDANGVGTGRINPKAFAKWLENHQDAIQAYENATGDTSLREKFNNVQNAQKALDDLTNQRNLLEKAYPLKPGGTNAELAERYFQPGSKGAEYFDQYLQHLNKSYAPGVDPRNPGSILPEVDNLFDFAVSKLREAAVDPKTGELDLAKYQNWLNRYKSALSRFPDELRGKLDRAADAQNVLNEQSMIRADANRQFEKSVARHYLGGQDPTYSIGQVLASKTPGPRAAMKELIGRLNNDPAAIAGLQRDFMDYLFKKVETNRLAGVSGEVQLKSDTFLNQLKNNDGPIRELFGNDTFDNLTTIGNDLKRSELSVQGTGLKGRSNTAPDTFGLEKHGLAEKGMTSASLVTTLAVAEAAEAAVEHLGGSGLLGKIVGFGGLAGWNMLKAAKAAGLDKVNDVVSEAALNPEIMRTLLAKLPKDAGPNTPIVTRFVRQMGLLGGQALVSSSWHRQPPVQESYGYNSRFAPSSSPSRANLPIFSR